MTAEITIQLKTPRWKALLKPYRKTICTACEAALAGGIQDSGPRLRRRLRRGEFGIQENKKWKMTVVLADDAFIRQLNRDYRGVDKPTNVLAFPARHPVGGAAAAQDPAQPLRGSQDDGHLGDIILALETIESEAAEQGKSFKDHAMHLLVHGTLHLLGYDHMKKKDATRMEAIEIKILKKLGVENPYLWE